MKNFLTIRSKKFTFLSSPLALLVLGACGGGGSISTGPYGGSFVGSSSSTVGGNVVKGPLSNALVGLDYDGDGVVRAAGVTIGRRIPTCRFDDENALCSAFDRCDVCKSSLPSILQSTTISIRSATSTHETISSSIELPLLLSGANY